MGLWVAQCVRHELGDQYSFGELADLAQQVRPFQQFIDINDERFTNPENMIKELRIIAVKQSRRYRKHRVNYSRQSILICLCSMPMN